MYDAWKANDDQFRAADRTIETVQHIVLLRDGSTRLPLNAQRIDGIGRERAAARWARSSAANQFANSRRNEYWTGCSSGRGPRLTG